MQVITNTFAKMAAGKVFVFPVKELNTSRPISPNGKESKASGSNFRFNSGMKINI